LRESAELDQQEGKRAYAERREEISSFCVKRKNQIRPLVVYFLHKLGCTSAKLKQAWLCIRFAQVFLAKAMKF